MAMPDFATLFATNPDQVRAAQRLRYDVFVRELGSDGAMVDHAAGLECDHFDAHSEHLLLLDKRRGAAVEEQVVGAYRVMTEQGAQAAGGFYSEREYDLSALTASRHKLMELGRSCMHRDYRGGPGMFHLWNALAQRVTAENIDLLFGVASFHGTDPERVSTALSLLHHRHLAPAELRVKAKEPCTSMDLIAEDAIDRRKTMVQMPPLIKAYLRIGGYVGQGAYLDHAFNTTDVCLILPVAQISARQRRLYDGARAA